MVSLPLANTSMPSSGRNLRRDMVPSRSTASSRAQSSFSEIGMAEECGPR